MFINCVPYTHFHEMLSVLNSVNHIIEYVNARKKMTGYNKIELNYYIQIAVCICRSLNNKMCFNDLWSTTRENFLYWIFFCTFISYLLLCLRSFIMFIMKSGIFQVKNQTMQLELNFKWISNFFNIVHVHERHDINKLLSVIVWSGAPIIKHSNSILFIINLLLCCFRKSLIITI